MILTLTIHNIILIEHVELTYSGGLNVFTGETGVGKSALMEALRLVLGYRYQKELLRHKEAKGYVEARIEVDKDKTIHIRRELFADGKSKAYLNQEPISLSELQKVCEPLVTIVGQHAHFSLLQSEQQRMIVDQYAGNDFLLTLLSGKWKEWKKERKTLKKMLEEKSSLEFNKGRLESSIDEIEKAQFIEGEEEELFSEFTRLNNKEELLEQTKTLMHRVVEKDDSILAFFKKELSQFEELSSLDKGLEETFQTIKRVTLELDEITYLLRDYRATIDMDPYRLEWINERLQTWEKLKKKYGVDWNEIQQTIQSFKKELDDINNYDERLDKLEGRCKRLEEEYREIAEKLSLKRKKEALLLEKEISNLMPKVKLPNALLFISITKGDEGLWGSDQIEWRFRPNIGEKELPLKDSASGGELSRILLLLYMVLSKKIASSTFILDEIDSGIGGETASSVGEIILELSTKHQVFCITHLPQIASLAETHFSIDKVEKNGRTVTQVSSLPKEKRTQELQRMLGGEQFINPFVSSSVA